MYTLYHKKDEGIIEVKKAHIGMRDCNYTDDVTCHNDCYYICLKRKPLIEKAKEIKKSWLDELEEKMRKIESIEL